MKLVSSFRLPLMVCAVAVLMAYFGAGVASKAEAQQPSLSISSLSLPLGGQGSVTVQASDIPAPGLGAWLIDVTYSQTDASAVSCTSPQQFAVCNESYAPGVVRIAGVNDSGLQGNFTLATITFQCNSNAAGELRLHAQRFVDSEFHDIVAVVQNGTLTCGSPVATGDANCDGTANSLDAALVLQYAAGLVAHLACQAAADVDADGDIDPVDAALVLQFDAGLIPRLPP